MGWMTLIGDLHGRLPVVRPDSYLLLLAGDIAPDDGQYEFLDGPFRAWLRSLPCPCVAVTGNHDKLLCRPFSEHPPNLPFSLLRAGETVEVAGLRIWGCPVVLGHQGGTEEEIERACETLSGFGLGRAPWRGDGGYIPGSPGRCDVMLSHNPPLGILDRPSTAHHLGSLALRYAIWKQKPRLAVFGHVHESRGWARVDSTYCVNATLGAGCNGTGRPIKAPYGPWGLSDGSWKRDTVLSA